MAIKTPEEYRESIRDGRQVYCLGEKVSDVNTHPVLGICTDGCAMDYVLAQDARYRDLFVEQNEEGEPVHFTFIPGKSSHDLLRRRQIIQTAARCCFGLPAGAKFTGIDGLNALAVVCRRVDRAMETTNYTERIEAYRKHLQKTDAAVALAMTDAKGDRSLRPSKQPDRDLYLRVVDESKEGIVVRGAKLHISLSPCANEIIVVPCRAMREEEKEYALSFGIQPDTKGLTFVSGGRDAMEEGNYFDNPLNARLYGADALVIFDDVFVPWERVFLCKEWRFAADTAYVFADFHRLSADAYKYTELEILVGAAALIAEYNGLERVPHVQDKLSWLMMYAEGTEALGRVACENCVPEPETDLVYPNPMFSNIAKFFFAENYHQAVKLVQDIAGGIVATAPSSKDFYNPAIRPMIEKYLAGKAGIPTEHRLRAIKLVRDLSAATHAVTTVHAEGSLAAQRLSIYALADFERYKAAAKRVAGIDDGTKHPLFSELPRHPSLAKELRGR